MKQIIMHAGFHKTATSSIQDTCARNKDKLEELGLYYPLFKLEHRVITNHSIPFYSLFTNKPDKYHINVRWGVDTREANKKYEEQLDHILNQKYKKILISGESISMLSALELDSMRKKIQSYDYEICVIIFIRPTSSAIHSVIQERVKGGVSIEEINYHENIINKTKHKIEKIESIFPEAKFFSFGDACQHQYGPVGYFLEIIGVSDLSSLDLVNSNESISAQATRLISFINKEQPLFINGKINPFRKDKDMAPFYVIKGDKFQLYENELEKFKDKINQEHKYLLSKFDVLFCDEKQYLSSNTKELKWSNEQLEQLKIAISKVDENIKMIAYDYFTNVICLDKEKLSHIFQLQQNNGITNAIIAKAMMAQKNIQGAIAAYQKAIALQPEQPAWVYIGLGDALNQNGQIHKAIVAYQKAIELKLHHPSLYLSLEKVYFKNTDLDIKEAIVAYQKAIKLKPDHPYFYVSLAKLYFENGDLDDAIANYQQAINLKQDLPFWVYQNLGKARRFQSQGNVATTSLKPILYTKENYRRKKYKVVVCTTFKNEAPYILEWIAYHRIMKVDHFLIYDNGSTDETSRILKHLDRAGIITYIDWPSYPHQKDQIAAYKDGYLRLLDECEWIAFIDADEFIVPNNKYNDLHSFLSDYEDVAGIAINWKIFGSSGHISKSDGLVMERFKRCATLSHKPNRTFKTIAKIDLIQNILNPHACEFPDNNSFYVHPNRSLPLEFKGGKSKNIDHEIIQINHYFTKSQAEWALKKARGRPTVGLNHEKRIRSEAFFIHNDRNEEEDVKILRFLEKTKQEIKFLTEVAGLEPMVNKLSSKSKIQTFELATAPLLTVKAINFLKDFLKQTPDAKVLEFGSGASTLWLSKLTKNLVSIEHHPEWYEKVKSNIAKNDDCNSVDLRLLPRPYYTVCEDFPDQFFDLIIVDGRDRVQCLEASIRILKRGGVMILDDAQRERYQKSHDLLKDWEFTRTINRARQTHWWEKPLIEKSVIKEWTKVHGKNLIRLYAGNLTPRAKKNGWMGVSILHSDEHHIKHDLTKLFPISDGVVDAFQSEDVFEHIHPSKLLAVTFPEIYRIMKPGGLIRISVPDYRCDFLLDRSWKDEQGKPYYDPGPGRTGKTGKVDWKVTHRGHVWFPTYEQLWSLIEMSPLRYCQANWLHYYDCTGKPVTKEIDYSKGFIKRTPDHDSRVQNPRRPMSIVVDLYK